MVLTFGFSSGRIAELREAKNQGAMDETIIDEPVKVWAFFDPSASSGQVSIFPTAFLWRRRLIKLEKLIFVNTRRIGQTKIVDLVCSGETANFELEYNTNTYVWKLKKVMGNQ